MEKISFIVTVYNRLEYLRTVLFSLLNQTKQIDELIIADDGSKEDVIEYIKDILPRCPFSIKHVKQEDLGFRAARSRNNGVRVATGDFLIFVDQDLIFPNDFVEKFYTARGAKKMIFSRPIISTEKQKNMLMPYLNCGYDYTEIYSFVTDEEAKKEVKHDYLNNLLYFFKLRTRGAKMASLSFSLYKNDFIAINGFDEKYIGWGEEDDDLGNRFFKYGGKTKVMNFEKYPIHLFHPFEKTKKESPNRAYYKRRKKEISNKNYRSEYGYDNSFGEDQYSYCLLKERGLGDISSYE